MNSFDVAIKIKADTAQLASSMNSAQAKLRDFGLAIDGVSKAFKMVSGPATDFLHSFEKQQDAEINLMNTMKASDRYNAKLLDSYKDFASALQKVTTYGDEETLAIMQMGLAAGISTGRIENATKGAIGLSEAYKGMGLTTDTAMKGIALAYKGDFTMLNRYIPEIRAAQGETTKMAILQEKMAQGFAIAKGETGTASGAIKQYSNLMGDFKEKLGGVVADGLMPFVKAGDKLFGVLNKLPKPLIATTMATTGLISAIVITKVSGLGTALASIPALLISVKNTAIAATTAISGLSASTVVLTGGLVLLTAEVAIVAKKFIDWAKAVKEQGEAENTFYKQWSKHFGGYGTALKEIKGLSIEAIAENKQYQKDLSTVILSIKTRIIELQKQGKDTIGLQKQLKGWQDIQKAVKSYSKTTKEAGKDAGDSIKTLNEKLKNLLDNMDKLSEQDSEGKAFSQIKTNLFKTMDETKNGYAGKIREIKDVTDNADLKLIIDTTPIKTGLTDSQASVASFIMGTDTKLKEFKTSFGKTYQSIVAGIGHWSKIGLDNIGKVLDGAKTITKQQEDQMNDIIQNTTGDVKTAQKLSYSDMEKMYKEHTGHILHITQDEYSGIQSTMKDATDGMLVDWQVFWEKVKDWLTQLAIKLGIEATIAAVISSLSSGSVSFGTAFSMVSGAAGDMGFAEGGYIPATPGGKIIKVAEGGEGEYIVPESKVSNTNVQIIVKTADPATTVEFYKNMPYTNKNELFGTLQKAVI